LFKCSIDKNEKSIGGTACIGKTGLLNAILSDAFPLLIQSQSEATLNPESDELVFTERGSDPSVIEKADLVTKLKEITHYYQKGIQARIGIEK
jgi:hypothetical protein